MCCFIKENTFGISKGSKLLRKRGLRHLLGAVGTCAGLSVAAGADYNRLGLNPGEASRPPRAPCALSPGQEHHFPAIAPPPTQRVPRMNTDTAPGSFPQEPATAPSSGSAGRDSTAVPVPRTLHAHPASPADLPDPAPAALSERLQRGLRSGRRPHSHHGL